MDTNPGHDSHDDGREYCEQDDRQTQRQGCPTKTAMKRNGLHSRVGHLSSSQSRAFSARYTPTKLMRVAVIISRPNIHCERVIPITGTRPL